MTDETDLGPCCVCEDVAGVRNVLMLHHPAPIAGRGWGCFVCNLPNDGALAVVCDECLGKKLKFACRGFPGEDGRIPIGELLQEPFDHDEALHMSETGIGSAFHDEPLQ